MARTPVHARQHPAATTPPAAPAREIGRAAAAGPRAVPKAYELTDPQGHRAYLWRDQGEWVLEADDPVFRRRILAGLKKPIWSVEDEADEFGVRWSTGIVK